VVNGAGRRRKGDDTRSATGTSLVRGKRGAPSGVGSATAAVDDAEEEDEDDEDLVGDDTGPMTAQDNHREQYGDLYRVLLTGC
jgi:hypothetical protein